MISSAPKDDLNAQKRDGWQYVLLWDWGLCQQHPEEQDTEPDTVFVQALESFPEKAGKYLREHKSEHICVN